MGCDSWDEVDQRDTQHTLTATTTTTHTATRVQQNLADTRVLLCIPVPTSTLQKHRCVQDKWYVQLNQGHPGRHTASHVAKTELREARALKRRW